MRMKSLVAALLSAGAVTFAHADITVGVLVSATGPAASLGIPEKNTFALMPTSIGGEKVRYIVLDDASDTTTAVKNTRKLISEDKVDVIIGSTITPNSLAMVDVVAEAETPMISMAASARIVEPVDAKRRWVFKTPQNDIMMSTAITEHMSNNAVKTVAFIGFSDAYGEGWWQEFSKIAELRKMKMVASERFNRADTSVTGQILKIMSANPDAILIAGSGTPAALPQKALKEKGYKGITTSCASVARIAKAPYCPPARCWWPRNCRIQTRSRSPRSTTSASTRRRMAPAACPPSGPMPGMPDCCWRMRCRLRSRKASRAARNSALACAMRWKPPRTCMPRTVCST